MNKILTRAGAIVLMTLVALSLTRTAMMERVHRKGEDQGDVPGWAIASGAACVLAALVYAAYSNVINEWIARIA